LPLARANDPPRHLLDRGQLLNLRAELAQFIVPPLELIDLLGAEVAIRLGLPQPLPLVAEVVTPPELVLQGRTHGTITPFTRASLARNAVHSSLTLTSIDLGSVSFRIAFNSSAACVKDAAIVESRSRLAVESARPSFRRRSASDRDRATKSATAACTAAAWSLKGCPCFTSTVPVSMPAPPNTRRTSKSSNSLMIRQTFSS